MKRFLCLIALAATLLSAYTASAQVRKADFTQACDSLHVLIEEYTTVKPQFRLSKVTVSDKNLNFHFNAGMGEIPWRTNDLKWLKGKLKELMPEKYASYNVGEVFSNNINLKNILLGYPHCNGNPGQSKYRTASDPRSIGAGPVREIGGQYFPKGLSNRNIAVWQSHGRFYDEGERSWAWQRSPNFMTVEDMFTQSFVLQYLIPMLENAGAYTMTPRERDIQRYEIITDNDPAFEDARDGFIRRKGEYTEYGKWKDAGTGFADKSLIYKGNDNPFEYGTARKATCSNEKGELATIVWRPDIPERGEYAVYISYKTLPESTTDAHYTIHCASGTKEFAVNQQMGGGTWIYVGTFEFMKGKDGYITLDNSYPADRPHLKNRIVTADAVKIGGGMGKIARGNQDMPDSLYTLSGMPSYMEGALYWMQWAGIDTTITRRFNNDYINDFADRGAWVEKMSGGSRTNPKVPGKGIPTDLSLAFHSDAGITPNDSTIGTLVIYTSKCEGSTTLPTGESRYAAREFADIVQTQVVDDIRESFDPQWNRRGIWDKSYSESRTTTVPGMILELLSHQNFSDMKFGHDPEFKATVARAVYKGILKYLSNRYGCPYEVQPLPVKDFAVEFDTSGKQDNASDKVRLSWRHAADPLEPTATAKGYILYTRVDDGAFDNGKILSNTQTDSTGIHTTLEEITPGHVYSYRIVAFNDGGRSFPSLTIAAGLPAGKTAAKTEETVLIVNNFDRISGPVWFDTPDYAGFDTMTDMGVPYIRDISYIGDMYQFRRPSKWISNANPGFGGSYSDNAGRQTAGNTFDYISVHGKSLIDCGYAFYSASREAFTRASDMEDGAMAADLICGKQITTAKGSARVEAKYSIFPSELQGRLRSLAAKGRNILLSGANIGTDVWDSIYCHINRDSTYAARTQEFVETVLGYSWFANYASRTCTAWGMRNKNLDVSGSTFSFTPVPNEEIYCVETPDGIVPSDKKGSVFMRYRDTNVACGVCSEREGYRCVSLGFPIEVLSDGEQRTRLMQAIMSYFNAGNGQDSPQGR